MDDFKVGDILSRCVGFLHEFSWNHETLAIRPCFQAYRITKVTPKGMWLCLLDSYGKDKPRFQLKEVCRFASRTETEAVQCFYYRQQKRLKLLYSAISHSEECLRDADQWLKLTKLEIPPVTTASD